jgi:hypothetical protein
MLLSILNAETSHLVQKTKELIETQTKLFEHTLARMLSQAFSQAEASLHKAASRLETCYAQITETEQVVDRSGEYPSRDAIESALRQTHEFEGNLANIAKQFESGIQAELATIKPGAGHQDAR